MTRRVFAVAILFLCMIVQPVVGNIAAPNDSQISGNSVSTLSIDGFVTTKFASVGSEVDIQAYTMGHTSNAMVSADIVQYETDPLDSVVGSMFPGTGQFIDRVVLQSTGVHENDSSIMTWQGTYTIPVSSTGGVYGARIFVEDGQRYAMDDPTQLRELFRGEFEKVLKSIDTAWDSANPLSLIADEFYELEEKGTSNGGWSNFVAVATEGGGTGGSQQLWDNMLNAGHNQYNMSAGANFLEALMNMLDSDDADAGITFITGLMMYLHNIPIPRSMYQFEDLAEYIQTYNAIENFTNFEGTDQFEAAYNGLIGSSEWDNMTVALDNLANGTKPFESAQTLMRNIALLAVSIHPQAIIDGLTAYAEPLFEGDFDNMTPFQQFVLRFAEMAGELSETDFQDVDGDDIPDVITFQYEYLLETQEGQTWTLKMQTDAPWVNDAFDDFNTLPEDVLEIVIDSTENPVWEETGGVLADFGSWMNNATRAEIESEWPNHDEDSDEEDESNEDSTSETDPVIFDGLYPMQTTEYDSHLLEVGINLRFDTDGSCDGNTQLSDEDWDNEEFSISMTNDRGYQVTTELVKINQWDREYVGILLAPELESTSWTLSQPLEDYRSCDISHAHIKIDRSIRGSVLGTMSLESNDEIFMVSAVGVLVDQPETSQVGQPYTVTSQTYDATGIISDAEADIAILRISPQLGESAIETLSPQGEQSIDVNYPDSLYGQYTGQDLDGDMTIEIMPMGEYRDDNYERVHSQSYEFEAIELSSNGNSWDASNYLPNERGVVDLVISGTTTEGIEFSEMKQMPLPGSLGCISTEGSAQGNSVDIGYNYRAFDFDEGGFYKPDLHSATISWGDGQETSYTVNDWEDEPSGWESHNYDNSGEYYMTLTYQDEFGSEHIENIQYSTDQGFWQEDDDSDEGGYWTDWKDGSNCWLDSEDSNTPSPEIIDNFLTDGPFEVVTEQVMDVDNLGVASLTFVPNHPGIYLTIVQSKGTLESGETKTGIGLNFAYITNGQLEISGLEQVTTFAGLPVYVADSANNGLNTITVTPSDIPYNEFNVSIGVAPIKIDVAFPDIDWDSINEPEIQDLEFQNGDASRNQELRFEAPISLLGIAVLNPDEQIMAEAIHFGIVLSDPSQLDMMGSLGPGQTTNVALNSEEGEATRIFAVAVPKTGFDPASVDFASVTSFIYDEGIRPNVGWVAADKNSERICEEIDTEPGDEWNNYNYRIKLQHRYDSEYMVTENIIDTSNVILMDNDENEIAPIPQMQSDGTTVDWAQEWEESTEMVAHFDLDSEMEYTLHTGTELNSEFEVMPYEDNHEENCDENVELSEEETFGMFDDLFGNVKSIAWGIGSSADLSLPHLASPTSNYTVLAMVQQGTGDSATISAAIGSQVAEPNPEPLVMKDLDMQYLPENPSAGDTMLITVTEDDSGLPVEMLSVVVLEDGFTIGSALTDSSGQTAFVLQEGTFLIRASGGMYNPVEFTITVTTDGSQLEDTADRDGDGIPDSIDLDDDNDGVDDIYDLCPETPVGDSVDEDGCSVFNDDDDDDDDNNTGMTECEEWEYWNPDLVDSSEPGNGCPFYEDGNGDDDDNTGVTECEEWEYWNPDLVDSSEPGNGCPFYEEEDEDTDKDSTSDSSENKILGIEPITLGAISLALILGLVAATMYVRKGGKDDDWYKEEVMFEEPHHVQPAAPAAHLSYAPSGPPPSHKGRMQDGYEVSEYPTGSGNWWWKNPENGSWSEWK